MIQFPITYGHEVNDIQSRHPQFPDHHQLDQVTEMLLKENSPLALAGRVYGPAKLANNSFPTM